jgi:hypothetical protein
LTAHSKGRCPLLASERSAVAPICPSCNASRLGISKYVALIAVHHSWISGEASCADTKVESLPTCQHETDFPWRAKRPRLNPPWPAPGERARHCPADAWFLTMTHEKYSHPEKSVTAQPHEQ